LTTTLNASNSGSGGLVATADASGVLALQTAGVTAVTIDASQNVGVGTASPGQKLEVAGNALLSNNQYFGVKDSTGAAVGFPIFTGSNDAIFGYLASGSTGISTYQFRTGNNVERMRIDSSGNVLMTGGGRLYLYNTPPNVGIDGTNSTVTITNGNSIDFSSFSGTLMVTEKNTTGSSAILLCGGTSTAVVGQTNGTNYTTSSSSGNIRWYWNPGSSAFRLQNSQGSTLIFNMVVVKTRDSP
jgi:hypothetical protein